jgi:2-methylcitrate dehydratase PrpD
MVGSNVAASLSSRVPSLADFVNDLSFSDLPAEVRLQAKRCVLDLVGTAAAGRTTPLSAIIRGHVVEQFGAGGPGARIIFDGRQVSPAGAALAGGMIIDSFDAHDGHVLTKGHAGAAVLPGLLAMHDAIEAPMDGETFLAALVLGYEVAIRAGIATHRLSPDYHTSGSWNALGVAAVAARLLGLSQPQLRHALGIAEYHGPRSQMMRCIDSPTMLKDGSGVGAMTGISAAYLARDGFTGAPALVVESPEVADLWSDLGLRWRILEMYFKPYPVCRWAQPAIRAVLELGAKHAVAPDAIEAVEIHTFHEAVRLAHPAPADTEQAQYSLPFPVAAALVRGRLGPADIHGSSLRDPIVLDLARRVRLIEDAALSARFPAERIACAVITLTDGSTLESEALPAPGDAEDPLSDDDIAAKFMDAAQAGMLGSRGTAIFEAVQRIEAEGGLAHFADLVLSLPDVGPDVGDDG